MTTLDKFQVAHAYVLVRVYWRWKLPAKVIDALHEWSDSRLQREKATTVFGDYITNIRTVGRSVVFL